MRETITTISMFNYTSNGYNIILVLKSSAIIVVINKTNITEKNPLFGLQAWPNNN
jgi:hypothetical protein